MTKITRRRFLTASAALGLPLEAVAEPMAASEAGVGTLQSDASRAKHRLPRDVGRKFNVDGSVGAFAANTFIGHLPQQGEGFAIFDALLDIYREFPRHPFHKKFSLVPPSSYHITVFGGLNDRDRGTPRWVESIPENTPIEHVTQAYLQAVKRLKKHEHRGFKFVLDNAPPERKIEGSLFIPLRPADEATDERLRELRDVLSKLTGIRRADHDTYKYHVTIGYIHQFLTAEEADDLQASTLRWIQRLKSVAREFHIPALQFCRLRDMYAFQVLHEL